MFAINYGQVSMNQQGPAGTLAGNHPAREYGNPAGNAPEKEHPILMLTKGETLLNGTFTARLVLGQNQSTVKAIHAVVALDAAKLELLGVSQGSLLGGQGAVFFKNLQAGAYEKMIDDGVRTGSGHVGFYHRDYLVERKAALASDHILWLTDRKGRRVGVPASRISYVEFATSASERVVGFGNA